MPNLGIPMEHLLKRTKTLKQTGSGSRGTRKASTRTIINSIRGLQNYDRYFITLDCDGSGPFTKHRTPSFTQLRLLCNGERLSTVSRNIELLLKNWLHVQIQLATALQLLHSNGLVHGDVHLDSIIIDKDYKARLCSFGHSYSVKDLDVVLEFKPSNDNHAPELDYVAGVLKGLPAEKVIKTIFEKKAILNEIDEVYSRNRSGQEIFTSFTAFSAPDSYLRSYGTCADMWSLGYQLYTLYKHIITSSYGVHSDFYRRCHHEQMRILGTLLHPDPRQRLTADALLTELFTIKMNFNE